MNDHKNIDPKQPGSAEKAAAPKPRGIIARIKNRKTFRYASWSDATIKLNIEQLG